MYVIMKNWIRAWLVVYNIVCSTTTTVTNIVLLLLLLLYTNNKIRKRKRKEGRMKRVEESKHGYVEERK